MKRGSGNSKILPSPRRFSCHPSDAAIPTAGDVVAQGSPLGTRTRSHRALLGAGPSLGASTSDTKGPRGSPAVPQVGMRWKELLASLRVAPTPPVWP